MAMIGHCIVCGKEMPTQEATPYCYCDVCTKLLPRLYWQSLLSWIQFWKWGSKSP
jgi:hypothetical protein